MLLFLPDLAGTSQRLFPTLEEAQFYSDRVFVVDAPKVPGLRPGTGQFFEAERVPDVARLNAEPYLRPRPVEAGGGYVVREGEGGLEVLMIFRRSFWDLPKGKRDAGESIEACALREVREEVGIERLHTRRGLGTTVHGYSENGRYCVKTTHWFLMTTPETAFIPQEQEDIVAVEWVAWSEALARIGFPTLRAHMEGIAALISAR